LTRRSLCSLESFRNLCGGFLASHTFEKADIIFRPRSPSGRLLRSCNSLCHIPSCCWRSGTNSVLHERQSLATSANHGRHLTTRFEWRSAGDVGASPTKSIAWVTGSAGRPKRVLSARLAVRPVVAEARCRGERLHGAARKVVARDFVAAAYGGLRARMSATSGRSSSRAGVMWLVVGGPRGSA
jgi:hypothetical protein